MHIFKNLMFGFEESVNSFIERRRISHDIKKHKICMKLHQESRKTYIL